MAMKKLTYFIVIMLLLFAGRTFAQEGGLIRFDMDVFEKTVKATDEYKSSSINIYLAKDVFRTYAANKKVQVDFSEKDYQDAKKELSRLQKENESLQKAKEKAESDLQAEKAKVDAAMTEKQTLYDENKELNKKLADLPSMEQKIQAKDKSIEQLNGKITALNTQIGLQQTRLNELDAEITQLATDTVSLGKEKRDLQNQIARANNNIESLRGQLQQSSNQITSLTETIIGLQEKNRELDDRLKAFTAVFDETEKTISDIYNANLSKDIVDMDPTQLELAQNTYNGMKLLLAVDSILLKDLEGKIDEMNVWKVLIDPFNGAKNYMKGKYDDKERRKWIVEINNLDVTSDKAHNEKEKMLKLLNDQETLYDEYRLFFDEFLIGKGCPGNEISVFKSIQDRFERMKSYSRSSYHENTYDSYDRAIQMIESEFNNTSPSERLKDLGKYRSFISELEQIF